MQPTPRRNDIFDGLISKHAQIQVLGLHQPLDGNQAADVVDWFRKLKEGNPKDLSVLQSACNCITPNLIMYMSVLLGTPIQLEDPEVQVEDLGIGAVLTFQEHDDSDYSRLPEWMRPEAKEPDVVAYHDYVEERVYLLDPYQIAQKGLFGATHGWLSSLAMKSTMTEAVRDITERKGEEVPEDLENTLDFIPDLPDLTADPTMDDYQFMNLPEGQRTMLTYMNWMVQFNEARKYEISEKSSDIKFQIDMRRQFAD